MRRLSVYRYALMLSLIMGFTVLCSQVEGRTYQSKKVLIILAHPNPASFNHAIAETVTARLIQLGHEVMIRDLYQEGFQPVLSLDEWKAYENQDQPVDEKVLAEQQAIAWADHLIFIYPTWWWAPPAMLKGYLDRVFTPVFAFETDLGQIRGKLAGKKVTVLQTTGAGEDFILENGMDESVKKLMALGIFEFCGMEVLHHELVMGVTAKSYDELKNVLEEVDALVSELF